MRLPVHAAGRPDRQDQHHAAELARLHPRASSSAAAASPTCSPSAAGSTTRPTSPRCCACRARSAASPWSCRTADGAPAAGAGHLHASRPAPTGSPLLIRTTVFDARDRRAYERELLRARQEADRERERLQRLVATLQRSLLPPALPAVPGMEVAAHYHIASPDEVGGDFYDLFPLADDRWAFFLGDVCGKGAEAAAVTSLARYTLRAAAVYDPDPVSVLDSLNEALLAEYSPAYPFYCTVLFGLLTVAAPGAGPGTVEITLTGGGHPPALVIRGSGAVESVHPAGGLLVGLMRNPHFATVAVRLEPGDGLLLYTDGLTEARMPDGDLFGDDRLEELAATLSGARAPDMTEAVARVLTGFGPGLNDDTALLALTVPSSSPKASS